MTIFSFFNEFNKYVVRDFKMKYKNYLTKIILLLLFFVWAPIKVNSNSETEMGKYTKILLEVGAISVEDIDRKYWVNSDTPKIFSKGERVDINGWISPYELTLHSGSVLIKVEKPIEKSISKIDLINWYKKYNSYLSLKEYNNKELHPLHFTIMYILVEIMLREGLPIDNKSILIELYKNKVGNRDNFLIRIKNLLKDNLTYEEAIDCYKFNQDYRTLVLFPTPQKNEHGYINYLKRKIESKNSEIYTKWYFYKLLFEMNQNEYKNTLLEYTFRNVLKIDYWHKRLLIYDYISKIKNQLVFKGLSKCILNDPATECREYILYNLCEEKIVDKKIIDSVFLLAQNKGAKHYEFTPSRMVNGWEISMLEYLYCIKCNEGLKSQNKEKINKTINILKSKLGIEDYDGPIRYR